MYAFFTFSRPGLEIINLIAVRRQLLFYSSGLSALTCLLPRTQIQVADAATLAETARLPCPYANFPGGTCRINEVVCMSVYSTPPAPPAGPQGISKPSGRHCVQWPGPCHPFEVFTYQVQQMKIKYSWFLNVNVCFTLTHWLNSLFALQINASKILMQLKNE